MANTAIHLTERVRDNLASLKGTQTNVDLTNSRVNTGLKVQNANDDPVAYFRSKSLYDRSETFESRAGDIKQGIDTVKSIQTGIDASRDMIAKMKAYVNGMQGADSKEEYTAFHESFIEFARQFNDTIADDKYNGASYLNNTSAKSVIRFSTNAERRLELHGTDIRSATTGMALINSEHSNVSVYNALAGSGLIDQMKKEVGTANALGLLNTKYVNWAVSRSGVYDANTVASGISGINALEASKTILDTASSHLNSLAVQFQAKMSILESRKSFTADYVDDLKNGADDLVLADTEKEGANLMSLKVQQSLGYNSLTFAGKQTENILQLVKG